MTLLNCPDCDNAVSDQAPACPQCGRPMTATTTERTSKRLKGWLVVYGVVLVFGIMGACLSITAGEEVSWIAMVLLVVGILGYVFTQTSIWWEHE